MPVLDGYQATSQLRAMGVRIPILGVTGNALAEDRETFARAGADDVMCKPVDRARLQTVLNVHCPIASPFVGMRRLETKTVDAGAH